MDFLLQVGIAIYSLFMLGFILFLTLRHRGRVKVRIHTAIGEMHKWVKPEIDGETLIIRKEKKKKAGWTATYDLTCINWVKNLLFGKHIEIDILPEASKAVSYFYEKKTVDVPTLNKQDVKNYAIAEALKQRGKQMKMELPGLFWLMFITQIFTILLIFLFNRGMTF